jgi:uncharacterized membrane protein required for colicin V production
MEIIGKYPGYTDAFTVNNGLALYLAFMTFSTVVGIGIFLVARMLLMIVTMIIKSFIPKRKSAVNRLFGFVVGAARGAVWSLAFTLVFSVVGVLVPRLYRRFPKRIRNVGRSQTPQLDRVHR